ncbi:alpha/beta hydrolase [Chitinophaga solisilvae]|uniref:alpha/beta hydrolase n=1 Tax=Chitinophaga solisilvae TaxID=1233460 RepID=UPI00136D7C0D|nr:alpha/beta hydrolase [Chitinophaga solisilvae]
MKKLLLSILLIYTATLQAQQVIPLYTGAVPLAVANGTVKEYTDSTRGIAYNVTAPTLTVFRPSGKAGRSAVIICPGGGYHCLMMQREGYIPAAWLVSQGITAFVLSYRLPDSRIMTDKSKGPLTDVQAAIAYVKAHADQYHIDPEKTGVMGFSAGGHLASSAAVLSDNTANKPAFSVLIYPVISMSDSIGHRGSRDHLLGADTALYARFSTDLRVNSHTAPAYIIHSEEDKIVPVENSIYYYLALKKNHVPAAMQLYQQGDHGFVTGMQPAEWLPPVLQWMRLNGWN